MDVKRARNSSASNQATKPASLPPPTPDWHEVQEPIWEGAPDLPGKYYLPSPDTQTDVSGGRLEKWKRQLLDLSLRNKLLQFPGSAATTFLNCPDPAKLKMLADGEKFKILPDPRVMLENDPRSQELHRHQNQEEACLHPCPTSLGEEGTPGRRPRGST